MFEQFKELTHVERPWPSSWARRLDWSWEPASCDYIQLYHGNASLLAESLEVMQCTSAVILAALRAEEPENAAV
jgi:hypothetical protein